MSIAWNFPPETGNFLPETGIFHTSPEFSTQDRNFHPRAEYPGFLVGNVPYSLLSLLLRFQPISNKKLVQW
jgi:hypothetical protein